MIKKLPIIITTIMLAFLVTACGVPSATEPTSQESSSSEMITIQHKLGETNVKKNPQKVVVFDYGVLDSLDKLGVEIAAVPQINLPKYLAKYKDSRYINAGGLKEPDYEKISEVEPDLIIISTRQLDLYDEFSKIAPTIYMELDYTNYMESYTKNSSILGEIFDKQAEVENELALVNNAIQTLNEKASASGKNALIILANEGSISAYGPASRFGIIHDEFGLKAVDDKIEVSTHGQSISFEYIAEKNPDYLFVIDRGSAVGGEPASKQLIENELVKKTKAFTEGNIVYLDPDYWYLSGGGLISVSEMVNEVEKHL